MPRPKRKQDTVTRSLQDLELSENEAVLYAQMLEHPQSTVQELALRSSFPRTMLYHVLKQLIRRGLVSTAKNAWRTTYIAEDPEHLYDLLADKEREFEREANAVRDMIPLLKHRYRLAGVRPSVRIFEGVEEYRKALEDMLLAGKDSIRAYEVLREKKPAREMRALYDRKRVARKLEKKVLFFEDADAFSFIKNRAYDDLTQFRSIKQELVAPFSTDVALYDGKILYTSYTDHETSAVLIEDRALYDMQKNMFDLLWKRGQDKTLAHIDTP